MQPPYQVTSSIINLISEISIKIGEVNASLLIKQSPELRKRNRIKTIQASLAVEGNTLSVSQITAIVDNKRVLGPSKDILEVSNAIRVYNDLSKLNPLDVKSFLFAHNVLMNKLITDYGQFRKSEVGIIKGKNLSHVAPPASNVSYLMKDLFSYLKKSKDSVLLKSCVFHYEMEFIHPFSDGNGRMGRLWQTLILMKEFPLFEFLPFETLISKNQNKYYRALSESDKEGSSTKFIEFMLNIINESLKDLLTERTGSIKKHDRVSIFLSSVSGDFTRKDYMAYFKSISSATASRDLKVAVEENKLQMVGEKNKTIYKKK